MDKIYMVEHYKFYQYDEKGIAEEDAACVGYFSNDKQLGLALKHCQDMGIAKEQVRVRTYPLKYSTSQRYVYVLTYDYAEGHNQSYAEYYYLFPPCTRESECIKLRERLHNDPEYRLNVNKRHLQTPTGFSIFKIAINEIQEFHPF